MRDSIYITYLCNPTFYKEIRDFFMYIKIAYTSRWLQSHYTRVLMEIPVSRLIKSNEVIFLV